VNKKILWLSDSPFINTGFSTQSLFLMNGLVDKGWEVHYLGNNYIGQDVPPNHVKLTDGTPFKFHLHGIGKEQYCQDLIEPLIQKLRPSIYGVLLDTFMLYPKYLQKNYAPAKTVFWIPSDGGGGLPQNCELEFSKIIMPVPMSVYCERQIKDYYNIKTQHIPHAANTDLFHPLSTEEREKIKERIGLKGKFIVGVIGRNQGRKMMDRTFKSFKLFSKKAMNAILLLHTDPQDLAAQFDMLKLIERYSLQNRVKFTGMTFYNGFTYQQMNEVYNAFDVYFSTSSGEGFGVCTIEALSCGVPCVLPDYTTTHELLITNGQCGEPFLLAGNDEETYVETMINKGYNEKDMDIALSNGTITGNWSVERGLACIKDGALKLEKLYKDKALREHYGKIGREKVLKYYSWPVVIEQWDKRLTELVNE